MRELHALGPRGGAGRVVDGRGGVLVGDAEPRLRVGAEEELRITRVAEDHAMLHRDVAQQLVELGIDEQGRGAGVLEDVADLLRVEAEVHRHQDAPERADSEQSEQEARGVGGNDGHALVLADAEIVEGGGETTRHRAELRVGEAAEAAAGRARLVDHGLAAAVDMLGPLEEIAEGEGHDHGLSLLSGFSGCDVRRRPIVPSRRTRAHSSPLPLRRPTMRIGDPALNR